MNNNLMVFEGTQVEIFELDGIVYFNPYHVGECLELTDSAVRMAVKNMNDKQAIKLTNSKVKDIDFRKLHNTGENFLTESGVYKLIFRSNKPNAEKFTDWVTDEVLPTIRKEGAYITDRANPKMLRAKANEIENIATLNETAKIMLPVFDEAGLKPEYKALALKQIYRKGGLDIPIEGVRVEKKIFDLTTIASTLGIYSKNNKPHGQAVSAIVAKFDISDEEKEVVSFEKNGHMGTTTQYTKSVLDKVRKWIIANDYPTEIEYTDRKGNSKTYRVSYNKVGVIA